MLSNLACRTSTRGAPSGEEAQRIERGRLLVLAGSCNDCHTPWVEDAALGTLAPDWTRMLSGHPAGAPEPTGTLGPGDLAIIGPTSTSFRLPFGTTYAMNLTPDVDTGIGTWTEKMFVDIFRKGRHLGGDGRPIYPPMPWNYLRYLPDDDLKAIFAYLRSIPPIRNSVPTVKVPAEVEKSFIRYNDGVIALQRDPGAKLTPTTDGPPPPPPLPLAPVKAGVSSGRTYPAEQRARGERLVWAGLCNDCHTPYTFDAALGGPAPDWSRKLSGHPEGAPDPGGTLGDGDLWIISPTFTAHRFPFGVTYSMNLTPDVETGIGGWTEEQFLAVFRKGSHPDGRPIHPPMPWAMIRHLPDDDLRAIFAYLQSIPPIHNRVPRPKVEPGASAAIAETNAKLLERPR
ncbi:hypothetical protein L6R52_16530 [Myxococcota bacterium]|nr:hypothetical protein [Myxococcota bacterium]